MGNRRRVAQEIWAINGAGAVVYHDRLFLMDDYEYILKPLVKETPACMMGGIFDWLPKHPGPIYVPTVYPEIPGMVEYPLEDVLNTMALPYLNTTVAYAVAYAIFIGVKQLHLYGCDFTYPDKHAAESGRACVEFLLGIAGSRGVVCTVAGDSTLLDAQVPVDKKFYGYHFPLKVTRSEDDGKVAVERVPVENTEEVERMRAYDNVKKQSGTAVAEHHRIMAPQSDGQVVPEKVGV
jgi:hypothetical protein